MAATLPITENFDGMSTGELNGNSTGGSTWAGTNGVFTVSTAAPDSGANCVASVNSPAGNKGCFLPTNASFSGTQTFKVRVDGLPVTTDAYYVVFHNQTVGADPATGKIALVGIIRNGTNYDVNLSAASVVVPAGGTSISTSTYYTIDFQWDSTLGTKGQVRARVNAGAWTSWLDPANTNDFSTLGLKSIGFIDETDLGTNTIYFDTFTNGASGVINNWLLMGN